MWVRIGRLVRVATFVWGFLFLVAGVLLIGGWFPGADDAGTGPRVGLGLFLSMLGALTIGIPVITWVIRKTTRPEDYEGTCPVGRVCPDCGAFTFYPRPDCKSCGRDLEGVVTTGSKTEPL